MFKHRLPPLDPLVAFEAAARLLSFTRAAEELHLSQAAISQQIRSLEERLQVRLFTRSHRAVQLTNEGREYQHTVVAILKQLAGATMDITNVEYSRQLVIGSDQSFATYWLNPRLQQIRELLPGVALRVISSDEESESLGAEAQVSILHGDGNWTGYRCQRLFDEEVYPVCSPDYADRVDPDHWVDWLLDAELIDLADSQWNWMNWRLWLSGHDIDRPLGIRKLQINSYPLVIEAACDGHGVALGWHHLLGKLVDEGRLLRPLRQSLKTEFGYYLAYRETEWSDDTVRRFCDWLLREFDHSADSH